MRIDGLWRVCDDGATRPVFWGELAADDGRWVQAPFLADLGADRTVISADVWRLLRVQPLERAERLAGLGGEVRAGVLVTALRMRRDDSSTALFRGEFAVFTDPAVLDMSVLGRDILGLFALIADQTQGVLCLLGSGHRYEVIRG